MKNNPAEWRKDWKDPDMVCGPWPTFPTDGRETIYEPYEAYMPTTTVGEFLAAYKRTIGYDPGDDPEAPAQPPGMPADFGAYLLQRVPGTWGLDEYPADTPISRTGRLVPRE